MLAAVKKEIQLEIAHVLFIDIVGYSKLLINEQHELLQELNQVVRTTETFRAAEADGKLIRLPTRDGMALAFATTPASAQEYSDLEDSFIIRDGELLHIDFAKLLRQGDLAQNIYLRPGDVIYVRAGTSRGDPQGC